MMRLTRTGIGLLTAQYRSVLKKCALINAGLFFALAPNVAEAVDIGSYAYSDATGNGMASQWVDGGDNMYLARTPTRQALAQDTGIYGYHYSTIQYQTISASYTIIQNLEAIDRVIGSYVRAGSYGTIANRSFLVEKRKNNATTDTVDYGSDISTNLLAIDYVVGRLQNGNHISNMASMGDNVKALDTAIGAKQTGTYITGANVYANLKALDTQVAANTSTIAAHTAVINALDNNYYRNIKVSRAEKLKKSPLAERSECIQGSTDFFKKFEDALTIAAQSRHDGLIFVANDNTVTTTGNTTMYKKEA